MPALITLLLDEHGQALVGLDGLFVSQNSDLRHIAWIPVPGSLGLLVHEGGAVQLARRFLEGHVCQCRVGGPVDQPKTRAPVCSVLSKRSLVAMEVLVQDRGLGVQRGSWRRT